MDAAVKSGPRPKQAASGPQARAKEFTKAEPPADVQKISSDEAVTRIKSLAGNWKDEYADELNLPRELFMYSEGSLLVISKDESLSAMKILPALRADADPPKGIDAYGIMVYETAGSSYLVFVDSQRRVVVRDRISSFHSESSGDWERTMGVIRDALTLAGTNPSPDSLIFVDETRLKRKVL